MISELIFRRTQAVAGIGVTLAAVSFTQRQDLTMRKSLPYRQSNAKNIGNMNSH
jgi:hypothetical protein